MKKFLVATITSILLLIGIVAGSIYYEKYKIEHIVKSEDGKEAIEIMLRSIDNKALTSEGKIKSYKIDYNKVEKNPMGGINVYLIINDDPEMKLNTILVKGTQGKKYEAGAPGRSPKFDKLTNELEE
ncbi:DUF1310 family protein [Gemella sanguinis]|jgi:hypothetical protein|uniref:DUF1310 family protein n=1 Tax=Gemella sanguinis TaxID=84135 RepID=UPI00352EF2B3